MTEQLNEGGTLTRYTRGGQRKREGDGKPSGDGSENDLSVNGGDERAMVARVEA
jgi:hypothetical protein